MKKEKKIGDLAEFVQRADTPAAIGLDSHDFMQPHDVRGATGTESGRWMLNPSIPSITTPRINSHCHIRILDKLRELAILESSIFTAFQSRDDVKGRGSNCP
jgi:hypothetical protein